MNLLRALVTVSGFTLISRILGYARDFVIARAFGAGLFTDAFFVAFRPLIWLLSRTRMAAQGLRDSLPKNANGQVLKQELRDKEEYLQTTTEELETSKEELQSVNEELSTVNHELKNNIKRQWAVDSYHWFFMAQAYDYPEAFFAPTLVRIRAPAAEGIEIDAAATGTVS